MPRRPDLERGVVRIHRSHHRALHRAVARRARCVGNRSPVTRDGPPVQGNPFARRGGDGALGSQRAGARRPRAPPAWRPPARPGAAVVVAAVADPDAEIEEARAKVARGHRIFKIKTAARPVRRTSSACAGSGRRSVRTSPFAWTPIRLGPADGTARHPGSGALWRRLRRAAGSALGLRGHGRDRRRVTAPIMADESCFSPRTR